MTNRVANGFARGGITIGQAAAFVGVTVKTIRHYHQHGLIDEPGRDVSGYRRYGSAHLLRLLQVRTLADAGVPLAEIVAILDADPDRFATALVDVEHRLTQRIDELLARRDMLRRVATGDRVLLPDRASALLERMATQGLTPDEVTFARDAMVLVRALVPEDLEQYLGQIEGGLNNPVLVSLFKRWSGAGDWDPDDPRVDALAADWADHVLANPSLIPALPGLESSDDASVRNDLLSHHGEDNKPAWTRITTLIEQRIRAAGIDVPYQTPAPIPGSETRK
jgi:DNA-binding transcriptional MerR regulator